MSKKKSTNDEKFAVASDVLKKISKPNLGFECN